MNKIVTFLSVLALYVAGYQTFAQTSISPTAWNTHGSSASGPSGFSTLPATTTPGASVISISQWNRGAGLTVGSSTTSYNSDGWSSAGSSLSGAQSANACVYFTVTNNATTEVEVTNVTVLSQVSGTGPGNVQMMYAVGGGSDQTFGSGASPSARSTPVTFTFNGTAHICAGQTATFKLYGWNATSSAGTLRINSGTSITATFDTAVSITATSNSPVCSGGTLRLSSTASQGVPAYAYQWSGPSGYSSSVASPTATGITTSGTYSVVVTDAYGCKDTATTAVSISTGLSVTVTPSGITICPGNTTTLTASGVPSGGGYFWSPAIGLSATSGASVTASPASATIYTVMGVDTSGCSDTAQVLVNLYTRPTITSTVTSICTGSSASLSATPTGGSWSTGAASIASVSASGTLYGVATGSTNITYTSTSGCTAITTIFVTGSPVLTSFRDTICSGSWSDWTPSVGGGRWSSANASIAVVDSIAGRVTGVDTGITTITYTLPGGCQSTHPVTIVQGTSPLSGPSAICNGAVDRVRNSVPGGTWAVLNSSVIFIDAVGNITGLSADTTTVTYTLPNGCSIARVLTVNPLPALTGPSSICAGATGTFSSGSGTGVFSTSNANVSIGATSGIATAISAGYDTVTFTLTATGCYTSVPVLVNATPSAITGSPSVCMGSSITLTDTSAGGTWTSVSPSIATVSNTGIVTGVTTGITTISYSFSTGCGVAMSVNVLQTPSVISGPSSICSGVGYVFTDSISGGFFSSDNPSIASVSGTGATPATIYGAGAGTTIISYTLTNGCSTRMNVTAYYVSPITGASSLCAGSSIVLVDTTSGGTWSTGSSAIASVNASGVVTGVAAGTVNINYTHTASGCMVSKSVTVLQQPTTITGPSTLCLGLFSVYSNGVSGGTWASTNTSVASITASGGASATISGVSLGSATVSYTLTNGCYTTLGLSVSAVPPISGPAAVCVAQSITLTNTATGGSWSTSNPLVASVDGFGNVNGVSAGTAIITYQLVSGCQDTALVNVIALPSPITGSGSGVCASGGSLTLSTASSGGTWSTSNASLASIDPATGVVTGVISGTVTITWTSTATGCYITTPLSVNNAPSPISGSGTVCEGGGTTTLSSATSGATWSTSNATIASVDPSGIVTGVASGSATISYTAFGCSTTFPIYVAPLPGAVAVPTTDTLICSGSYTIFVAGTTSGVSFQWYYAGSPVAGATSAIYRTYSAGPYRLLTTSSYGCTSLSSPVSVSFYPTVATITPFGPTTFCLGGSVTLRANAGTGLTYQWLRGGAIIPGAISINYTATTSGSYTVIVSNAAGCPVTSSPVSVTVSPSGTGTVTSSGPLSFCSGGSVTLTADSVAGITYQWYNGSTAISGANSRTYTATATGNYSVQEVTGPCSVTSSTFSVSVVSAPTAAITPLGSTTFCTGATVTLRATAGTGFTYQWYLNGILIPGAISSNYIASVAGDYTVRVTNATGCSALSSRVTLTEVGTPTISAAPGAFFCEGDSTRLTAVLTGTTGISYQWQRGGIDIAGATNASYTALVAGIYSYTVITAAGCAIASAGVNVVMLPLPAPLITYTGGRLVTASTYRTYAWSRNGIAVFGTGNAITPRDTGTFTVQVVDSNGCKGTGIFRITQLTTAVQEVAVDDIAVYPNPATDRITISGMEHFTVTIMDVHGRPVITKDDETVISLGDLAPGLYMVKILNPDGMILKSLKLVKE